MSHWAAHGRLGPFDRVLGIPHRLAVGSNLRAQVDRDRHAAVASAARVILKPHDKRADDLAISEEVLLR